MSDKPQTIIDRKETSSSKTPKMKLADYEVISARNNRYLPKGIFIVIILALLIFCVFILPILVTRFYEILGYDITLIVVFFLAFCVSLGLILRQKKEAKWWKEPLLLAKKKTTSFVIVDHLENPETLSKGQPVSSQTLEKTLAPLSEPRVVSSTPEKLPDNKTTIPLEKIFVSASPIPSTSSLAIKEILETKPTQEVKTLEEIDQAFALFLLKQGLKVSSGFSFSALMIFSHAWVIDGEDELSKELLDVGDFLGHSRYQCTLHRDSNGRFSDEVVFLKAFLEAQKNPDHPIFFCLTDVEAQTCYKDLGAIGDWIKNPKQNLSIVLVDSPRPIPENLWLILFLKDASTSFDIEPAFLPFIASVRLEGEASGEPSQKREKIVFPLSLFTPFFRGDVTRFLSEEQWRRLDLLLSLFTRINGFVLDNRITNRIEWFLSISLTSNHGEEHLAVDYVLAEVLLPPALGETLPSSFSGSDDLFRFMDETFGTDHMMNARKTIKRHALLFDAEGKRLHG